MAKPILYGFNMSPPVRSALMTAHAIGLDYEFREVNSMRGEHLSEDFLKKNPQHTIPTLEDDGRYVWDSHAIAIYLVEKYGNDQFLYPKDLYKRAVIDQRLHFDSSVLFPRLLQFANVVRQGKNTDEAMKAIEEAYDFLEKFLVKDLYLSGNIVSVADLCCVPTVTTLNAAVPIDSMKYPKLSQWKRRMELLPYYQKANGEGLKQFVEALKSMIPS